MSEYVKKVLQRLDAWLWRNDDWEVYFHRKISEQFAIATPRPFRQFNYLPLKKPEYVFINDIRKSNRKLFNCHHWSNAPPDNNFI